MSAQVPKVVDIAIVGGGMVGASLAVALRGSSLRVALIEAHLPDSSSQPSFDERTTALGNASRRVFEALGLWPQMQADAAQITRIHVSDAGRFGFARLDAREFGLPALGYVVPNRVMGRVLWQALRANPAICALVPARLESLEVHADHAQLVVQAGTGTQVLHARLVVAADGAQSLVRKAAGLAATVDDYDQQAVVAPLAMDRPNDGTAFERFTSAGPMALLPTVAPGSQATRTLVWAARPQDAARLLELNDTDFMREWQNAFGWRAGRALRVGRRGAYPLALSRSSSSVAHRIALLGNASQALHPVAGQGFNLGLRDAAELAELLMAHGADPGAPGLLAQFDSQRTADRDGVIRFTDTLVRVFSDQRPAVAGLRDAGLLLFDLMPPAKRALSRISLGFGRAPRLARGMPLS
jgi:2-octaprenyl-6-methoxyphenol hydroxylase